MARDPGSLWSPLRENGTQGSHVKDKFIVHSTGDRGSAAAIYNYFNRTDIVVESTFVIGLSPSDPTRQLMDSAQTADANLGANASGISVETVGTEFDPFTDWQISELIRLGRWARSMHGIPGRVCPTATSSGFGWHVMFGAPGPWTPVAKSCPGKVRIQQLQDRVFPVIFGSQEEDDMFTDEDRRYLRSVDARLSGDVTDGKDRLAEIWEPIIDNGKRLAAVEAKLDQLIAAQTAPASQVGEDAQAFAKRVVAEIAADLTD